MMPGPAPQPTKLKLVHGTPGKRPLNDREPKPKFKRPKRPSWLTGAAHQHWRELVPLLEGMGVLTVVDGRALARYCRALVRWRAVDAFVEQHGEVYPIRDRDGNPVSFRTFPQSKIADALNAELRMMEREFGLTPSARSRITIDNDEEPNDPLQELIRRA